MPYVDSSNNRVEKGKESEDVREVSVSGGGGATETVTMSGLVSVTDASASFPGSPAAADGINDLSVSGNDVTVTLASGATTDPIDVRVVAEGY